MKAKNIVDLLGYFNEFLPSGNSISLKISEPWHFSHSLDHNIPFADSPGIFLFVRSADKWNISLEKNEHDILYFGKAEKCINEAVLKEMRHINFDKFPLLGTPPYNNHKWRRIPGIDSSYAELVMKGDIVLYSICVNSSVYDVHVVHSFLLNCFYNQYGTFPPLNEKILEKNL